MRMIVAAGVAVFLTRGPAHAAPMTAADLLAACGGDAIAQATCGGYLRAITDLVQRRASRGHGGRICLPESATADQVRDAVMTMSQRPRAANAPFAPALVHRAMLLTWPCEGVMPARGPGGTAVGPTGGPLGGPGRFGPGGPGQGPGAGPGQGPGGGPGGNVPGAGTNPR